MRQKAEGIRKIFNAKDAKGARDAREIKKMVTVHGIGTTNEHQWTLIAP